MRNIKNTRPAAIRPVPRRTCVACRQVKNKRELLRLVRTRSGEIEIDTAGKKEGRGAYLCPDLECWERAFRGRQLEHALRTGLAEDDRKRLLEQGREMLKGVA